MTIPYHLFVHIRFWLTNPSPLTPTPLPSYPLLIPMGSVVSFAVVIVLEPNVCVCQTAVLKFLPPVVLCCTLPPHHRSTALALPPKPLMVYAGRNVIVATVSPAAASPVSLAHRLLLFVVSCQFALPPANGMYFTSPTRLCMAHIAYPPMICPWNVSARVYWYIWIKMKGKKPWINYEQYKWRISLLTNLISW